MVALLLVTSYDTEWLSVVCPEIVAETEEMDKLVLLV